MHRNCIVSAYAMMLLAGLGMGMGCNSPDRKPPFPEPPRRPDRPGLPGLPIDPNVTEIWRDAYGNVYVRQGGQWYLRNPSTGVLVPIAGDPPGYSGWIYDHPPIIGNGGSLTRADLGIEPDANGQVSPRGWFNDVQLASATEITKTDRIDYYLFIKPNWAIPTDLDPGLLADIGPANLVFYAYALNDGLPEPLVLKLNDVTIRDLARFLKAMGSTSFVIEQPGGPWQFNNHGGTSVIIQFQNKEVYTIRL